MEDNGKPLLQSPSIKLIRNTKGYFFEIKILSLNVAELEIIRNQMVVKIAQWMKDEA